MPSARVFAQSADATLTESVNSLKSDLSSLKEEVASGKIVYIALDMDTVEKSDTTHSTINGDAVARKYKLSGERPTSKIPVGVYTQVYQRDTGVLFGIYPVDDWNYSYSTNKVTIYGPKEALISSYTTHDYVVAFMDM